MTICLPAFDKGSLDATKRTILSLSSSFPLPRALRRVRNRETCLAMSTLSFCAAEFMKAYSNSLPVYFLRLLRDAAVAAFRSRRASRLYRLTTCGETLESANWGHSVGREYLYSFGAVSLYLPISRLRPAAKWLARQM